MVNFINKIDKISQKILKTLKFFNNILVPFFKKWKKLLLCKKTNNLIFKKKRNLLNFGKIPHIIKLKLLQKLLQSLKKERH